MSELVGGAGVAIGIVIVGIMIAGVAWWRHRRRCYIEYLARREFRGMEGRWALANYDPGSMKEISERMQETWAYILVHGKE